MAANTTPIVYSDLSLSFLPHALTRDISILINTQAVLTAVQNLLSTMPGERPFQPTLGSDLNQFLFSPLDSITERLMVEGINQTLINWEPRAKVTQIGVTVLDAHSVQLDIQLQIVNQASPVTLSLVAAPDALTRIR
jgi:phage baseplate assembly protein W